VKGKSRFEKVIITGRTKQIQSLWDTDQTMGIKDSVVKMVKMQVFDMVLPENLTCEHCIFQVFGLLIKFNTLNS